MEKNDRLEKICDKALELFIEEGYDQTPLSRIASELGLTKAGLYHYFSSKEELLFHIHDRHMKKVFIPILERARSVPDPGERIRFFVRSYTLEAMTRDLAPRVLVHETRKLASRHREKIEAVWRQGFDLIREALSELEAAGRIKPLNKTFATFAALGMCSWTFYWFDYARRDSAGELADTYVEIFLRGLER